MNHVLKTWPEFFDPIWEGEKKFEVRKNDRDFNVGDILELKEWNPDTKKYGVRTLTVEVTYIMQGGRFGIPQDYCVMGIRTGMAT